ncbi:MAG: hypothetical protein J6P72_01625 [Firmicutes bacterium]|nr:hypothetical protein [Bacillota bacterium]
MFKNINKRNLLITAICALVLLIFTLFMRGLLFARSFHAFMLLLGDSLLVASIIFGSLWLLSLAWYHGVFDVVLYIKDGANRMHVENGRVVPKRSLREYGLDKQKTRNWPTHFLIVFLCLLILALIFSLLAISTASA